MSGIKHIYIFGFAFLAKGFLFEIMDYGSRYSQDKENANIEII